MNKVENPGHAHLPMGVGGAENAKNANQEIGDPSDPSESSGSSYWHSRGYLPHFESPEKIQHVTFHLADSLPQAVLERLAAELKRLPPEKQSVEQRQRIQAWLDAGHGSCVLRAPEIAVMVQNSLLIFDGQRYRLLAWVIMPNHIHVLFQPLNGWTVAKIVASWKKFTARKICDYGRANPGIAHLPSGDARNANQAIEAIGEPSRPVWHREYWDRYMRNDRHLQSAVEYIHQNPVKAGLVGKAEAWPWSSAYPGHAHLPMGDGDAYNTHQETGDPGRPEEKP